MMWREGGSQGWIGWRLDVGCCWGSGWVKMLSKMGGRRGIERLMGPYSVVIGELGEQCIYPPVHHFYTRLLCGAQVY